MKQVLVYKMLMILAILLFNEVEVLDFAGSFEVFSLAENDDRSKCFNVITIAENQGNTD